MAEFKVEARCCPGEPVEITVRGRVKAPIANIGIGQDHVAILVDDMPVRDGRTHHEVRVEVELSEEVLKDLLRRIKAERRLVKKLHRTWNAVV